MKKLNNFFLPALVVWISVVFARLSCPLAQGDPGVIHAERLIIFSYKV
jgi:hypothetical protein